MSMLNPCSPRRIGTLRMNFFWAKNAADEAATQQQLEVLQRKLIRSERAREQAEALIDEATRTIRQKTMQLAQREDEIAHRLDRTMHELVNAQKLAKLSTMYATSPDHLNVTGYFKEMFGFTDAVPATLDRILSRVHPLDLAAGERILRRARFGFAKQKGEIRILNGDGKTCWMQYELKRVNDGDGQPAMIGTLIDITEQRQAERHARVLRLLDIRRIRKLNSTTNRLNHALAQTDSYSSYLTAVLDSVSIGVAVFDEERLLVSWNEQLEQISGVPANRLYNGMSLFDYVVLHDFDFKGRRSDPDFDGLFQQGTKPLNIQRQRNNAKFLNITLNPAEDGKLVICYADISEQKFVEQRLSDQGTRLANQLNDLNALSDQLEGARAQAVDASAAKSRFLAMMSHDIRTPLNGLLGMLSILEEDDIPPAARKRFQIASNSGQQLRVLLDDIIDFARSESGQLRWEASDLCLQTTAEHIVDFWAEDADKAGVTLSLEVADTLPPRIIMDAVRLRQVLNNFISNALKYGLSRTRTNAITIRLSRADDGAGPMLMIAVDDRGDGIDERDQHAIFADYHQLSTQDAMPKEGGFGLGLAICRRIAEAQNGAVGYRRNDDGGSRFWMTLPLVEANGRDGRRFAPATEAAWDALHGRHVLIAEDLETNRLVLSAMLDSLGCSYAIACNGAEAVAMWQAERFDAILMDISMPVMGGIEAAAAIRALEPEGDHIPILGVTAHSPVDIQHAIADGGLDAVVVKPIQKPKLARRLLAVLNAKASAPSPEYVEPAMVPTLPPFGAADAYAPILDDTALAQFVGDEGQIDAALLSAIITDLASASAEFCAAIPAADRDAAAAARHKLKGLCETFGLSGLRSFLLAHQGVAVDAGGVATFRALTHATTDALSATYGEKTAPKPSPE